MFHFEDAFSKKSEHANSDLGIDTRQGRLNEEKEARGGYGARYCCEMS